MGDLLLTNRTSSDILLSQGGGKAANLAAMDRLGVMVPPWMCVPATAFQRFADSFPSVARLDMDHASVETLFMAASIDSETESAIRRALVTDFKPGDRFAVRSSGIGEDSADHSFAGQFSSYLNCLDADQVIEALKRCWASAFTERSTAYRRERGIATSGFRMGVVIQKMADADVAGVGFSRNPVHPADRDSLVISAVWGFGEGLVSGELDADHVEVRRSDRSVTSHIVDKEFELIRDESGGLKKQPVDDIRRNALCLSEAQIQAISDILIRLEAAFGLPQDIEWVIENGSVYLVQTRPITTLPPEPYFDSKVVGDDFILWDNSNITESYNGIVSPLTFSHVSRSYQQVYRQYCELMGVPAHVIVAHEPTFRNMLGLIRGRVYYNLGNWYRMVFLFPFAGTSKGFMETMMGVKQGLKPELAALFDFTKNPPRYSLSAKLGMFARNAVRLMVVRRHIDTFKADFHRAYSREMLRDYDQLSIQELLSTYDALTVELLHKWKAPILSDTRCMIFFGILKSLTEKWIAGDQASSLYNDLLSGQGDLPSTEPTRLLMRIAKRIDEGDEAVREWFITMPAADINNALADRAPEIDADFRRFIQLYGFRCVNELKLESTDLHEDPSFALDAIARFVRMKNTSVDAIIEREQETVHAAEAMVDARISGLKRRFFYRIVKQARTAVKDREDLRLLRTNIFGIMRRLYKALGRKFHALGLIDEPMDIFYLSLDEIIAFNEGRGFESDFKELTALRKRQFEDYQNTASPPDRFFTRGSAGANAVWPGLIADQDLLAADTPVSDDPNVLLGTPCSPGVVEGMVRVVRDMSDADGLNGDIMVAERTDPGWVPLFPSTSGLLIERGSLLSHSAIVARELGIPTIVGVHGGLLKRLKTGMRVRMDAGKGEIRILEEEP
jgi:phosphohistidine swiveling domain-containing protein